MMTKNHVYILIIAGLVALLGYQVWDISTGENAKSSIGDIPKEVVMYKNPGCQCCTAWAEQMQQAGFLVAEQPTDRLSAIKSEQGVPYTMGACHTAVVGDYVVEGHVPIEDVKRLLREQRDVRGLVVPGMPQGSPGMESPTPEPYKTYLLGNDGRVAVYAEHNVE